MNHLTIARSVGNMLALAFVVSMAAVNSAFAGPLADAFTAEVDKAELLVIGGIVLGIAGVIYLIRSARRTA